MTASRPLISVITVVYNGAATLEATLRSVLERKASFCEMVVIDGGSTDGTLQILDQYRDCLAVCISESDRGVYDAMNKAVSMATGRWIYFLGSDDTLRQCLDEVATYLKDDRTIYYGDVFRTGSQTYYGGPFGAWKLLRKNICHQAIFYPRAAFDEHRFELRYPVLADWEFNLRCFADRRFHFEHIPLIIANYNDATGLSSMRNDPNFAFDQNMIVRECLPFACYLWHRSKRLLHLAVDPLIKK